MTLPVRGIGQVILAAVFHREVKQVDAFLQPEIIDDLVMGVELAVGQLGQGIRAQCDAGFRFRVVYRIPVTTLIILVAPIY